MRLSLSLLSLSLLSLLSLSLLSSLSMLSLSLRSLLSLSATAEPPPSARESERNLQGRAIG